MKNIISIFLFLFLSGIGYSQKTNSKDSLDKANKEAMSSRHQLTHEQTLQIYSFNIEQGNQERELQQKYSGSDSMKIEMKQMETKKDELYRAMLPDEKYQLFKQKKLLLLSSGNDIIK